MFRILDGRTCFYQWDYNQKLIVEDPSIVEVHFCNRTDDCSLIVEVKDGLVEVPNILLQTAWPIRAYAYTGQSTKVEEKFKVTARSKPSDYVYTETEVKNYDNLRKEIEWLKENGVAVDLRNYATKTYVTSAVNQALDNYIFPMPEGYATEEYVDNAIANIKIPEGSGGACLLTIETITTGGTGGNVAVTGIVLDYSTMSINEGESFQLAATVLPSNATNNVVGWKSSNNSVATVNEGYVTGIAKGSATITAYALDNNSITAKCVVTVAAVGGGEEPEPEQPDTPDEPETPVEPELPSSGKIMLADVTPVNTGVMLKKDGKTEYAHSSCYGYYKIPYTEGMVVSTVTSGSYVNNYPPIMVIDNGVVTVPTTENTIIAGQIGNYVATLTGYSANAEVIVNVTNAGGGNLDKCYYITGGAE